MPANLVSRINLDLLYPPFVQALLDLLSEAQGYNVVYFATSGFRSVEDQRALYDKYLAGGPRAAPAGLSAHNYGLAVDLARRLGPAGVDWSDKAFLPLKDLCAKHGLIWGGTFKDGPHVQWPGFVSAPQLLPLKGRWIISKSTEPALSDQERLKDIWASIDGHAP